MHPNTQCVNGITLPPGASASSPSAVPLYQTATFRQRTATDFDDYDYSRSGNPTRDALEQHIAALEHGVHGFAFSSGMAAIAAVARLLRPGDSVILGSDIYGGTYRLFTSLVEPLGVDIRFASHGDLASLKAAVDQTTKLVFVETPSNPLQHICDVAAVADIAHEHGALLAVDNTFLSPYLQNPIDLGCDIVIHSATKHLSGHGDVTAGCIVVSDDAVAQQLRFIQNAEGSALGPFDCWLLLRGIKTLGIRLDRQQENAIKLARFLAAHPMVTAVHYAGLPEHPGYAIQRRQARGGGCVISFETGDVARSRCIIEQTRLLSIAVSFGSVNSTISLPCYMSHASIPDEVQQQRSLPRDLVRISVGIEHADDLIADLKQAMLTATLQCNADIHIRGRAEHVPA